MELFLIRHPEPDVPEGTCYGRSDIGLAGDAGAEAERLRRIVPAGIPVYTSPLRRCRSVAERLAPEPAVDERLVEMHFGEWEMRRWDEIEKSVFDAWVADILNFAPPGGESAAAMLARTLAFVDELLAGEAAAAAVVTHGGVLRVLFAHWLEVPPRRWPRLVFEFGAVSKVVMGRTPGALPQAGQAPPSGRTPGVLPQAGQAPPSGRKDLRVEYLNRR